VSPNIRISIKIRLISIDRIVHTLVFILYNYVLILLVFVLLMFVFHFPTLLPHANIVINFIIESQIKLLLFTYYYYYVAYALNFGWYD
jgi:hypothetical protein